MPWQFRNVDDDSRKAIGILVGCCVAGCLVGWWFGFAWGLVAYCAPQAAMLTAFFVASLLDMD